MESPVEKNLVEGLSENGDGCWVVGHGSDIAAVDNNQMTATELLFNQAVLCWIPAVAIVRKLGDPLDDRACAAHEAVLLRDRLIVERSRTLMRKNDWAGPINPPRMTCN